MQRVGVVVPTLFLRRDYLRLALQSLRKAGNPYVLLMGPEVQKNSKDYSGLFDQVIEEPQEGSLSSKLSFALFSLPKEVDLITWLGDDDLLAQGSLDLLESKFREDEKLVLVYGACHYIDAQGNKIGHNKSGAWAMKLARFGPFLAPQPGSLFRREAFESIGGLDPEMNLAFDFDLFLSLSEKGRVEFVNSTLAYFRWHENSLSVSQRQSSVREASKVRLRHASGPAWTVVKVLNPLVEFATLLAGTFLSRTLKFRSKNYKKFFL